MRESTSPPREPHNGSSSPHSPQSVDGEKKFAGNLSPSSTNAKLNNNESMFSSNLCPSQSPKQMRNTATSPTCRAPSRNGKRSFLQFVPPSFVQGTVHALRYALCRSQVNLVLLKSTRQRTTPRQRTATSRSRSAPR